jgi:cyanate permease
VDGFIAMLVVVALFGLGGPMISIGGPKTISEWFIGKSRGTAVGIYMTGPWIGGLCALSLTNSLIMPLAGNSWRLTFVYYGLFTLALGLLWWVMARSIDDSDDVQDAGIAKVFSELIRLRNVQILLLIGLFSFAVGHGFSSWLPNILENSGFSPTKAGFAASIPLATGIPGVLLMPRLIPAHLRSRLIALFGILAAFNLIAVLYLSGGLLISALITLGFFSSPFFPLAILILMDASEVDSKHLGSAGGMFFCVSEIGGFTGPLIMGVLVDITGKFLFGVFFFVGLCIGISILSLFLKLPSLAHSKTHA